MLHFVKQVAMRLFERIRNSHTAAPLAFAMAVGVGAGGTALLIRQLIAWVHVAFFEELGGPVQDAIGAPYVMVVVATGGLLVGLISKYLAGPGGKGVSDVMYDVAYHGGRIRPRPAIVRALAAVITIGSGGSAGREGAIVQAGATFGSILGQAFRLPDRRISTFVACGAAAGIAATFNAPIAGVMFALEIILARFTSTTFSLVVVSSTFATAVSRGLMGDRPAFLIPVKYSTSSLLEIGLFAVLGIFCAVVAQAFVRAIYVVEITGEKSRIPDIVKPAIGGAMVGLIGMWDPKVFGNGFDVMEDTLSGRILFWPLLAFCGAKIVATALTVGSGGSGGIFSPSLLVGATLGGAFGNAANYFFPNSVSGPGAYALVGMAALFSGAAHAPMTALFLIFEMTDNYRLILPLMVGVVLSAFLSRRISRDSMYTIKLHKRGVAIGEVEEVNLMDAITVGDAMSEDFDTVAPEMTLRALMAKLAGGHFSGYPVVVDGKLEGIVTATDVEKAIVGKNPDQTLVKDIYTKNVLVARPEQTLSHALALFGSRNIGRMPVVDPEDPDRVIGMLTRAGVVQAYSQAYNSSVGCGKNAGEIHEVSEHTESVLVEETLAHGALLAGKYVREAGFPSHSTLVTIRRDEDTIIPNGSTRLEPGDLLVVLATRKNAKQVKRWLKEHC